MKMYWTNFTYLEFYFVFVAVLLLMKVHSKATHYDDHSSVSILGIWAEKYPACMTLWRAQVLKNSNDCVCNPKFSKFIFLIAKKKRENQGPELSDICSFGSWGRSKFTDIYWFEESSEIATKPSAK